MDFSQVIPIAAILGLNTTLVGVLFMMARSVRTMSGTNIALNDELQEVVCERRASEKERGELVTQVSDLTIKLNLRTIEITQLKSEIYEMRTGTTAIIQQLTLELSQLKTALIEAQVEFRTMAQSIDNLSRALDTAHERIAILEQREKRLTLELATAQSRIVDLELSGHRKDKEISGLLLRVSELENALKTARTERDELLAQLESQQEEIDDLPGEGILEQGAKADGS